MLIQDPLGLSHLFRVMELWTNLDSSTRVATLIFRQHRVRLFMLYLRNGECWHSNLRFVCYLILGENRALPCPRLNIFCKFAPRHISATSVSFYYNFRTIRHLIRQLSSLLESWISWCRSGTLHLFSLAVDVIIIDHRVEIRKWRHWFENPLCLLRISCIQSTIVNLIQ